MTTNKNTEYTDDDDDDDAVNKEQIEYKIYIDCMIYVCLCV